ncbi:MAG: PorV/PorQ family protein [candidate division FCPU426 bacterium]
MIRWHHLIAALGAAAVWVAAGWADQTDFAAGKVGASELGLGLGSRPVAMGEAFIAKADDVNATAWNPAGLAQIGGIEAGFMHNIYLQGTSVEYLAYAQNIFGGSGLGANLMYINYGQFSRYVVGSDGLPEAQGDFTPSVLAFSAGYGQWLVPMVAVGATIKYFSQTIDTESYSAVAFDAGVLVKPPVLNLQLGAVVRNLGTPVLDFNLPLAAKVGAAYKLPVQLFDKDSWNVLLDVDVPFGDTRYVSANLGTEYWYTNYALRLGYKIRETGGLGGSTGLTLGLGIRGELLVVDYALAAFGDLGTAHQFSVGVHF